MKLRQLIQSIATLEVSGSLDCDVRGIAFDSRRVTPGVVFVALKGENVDGHDFILEAVDRGAAAIVCEREGYGTNRVTNVRVENPRKAMAQMASVFYGHPGNQLKVIGVTGTNGKTTVSFLVAEMLRQAGLRTGLIGTIRYEIGDRMIPATRTTPESLDIQQMLGQMVRAGCQACVIEVSSHAIEQHRVLGVNFDVTIFTNLSQDHLDYHGTMDGYYAAKLRLFNNLYAGTKKMAAVINIDDAYGARMEKESDVALRLTYGLGGAAELRASDLRLQAARSRFNVEYQDRRFQCETPLIGHHNVYNALAALGAGLMLDLKIPVLQKALHRIQSVPGRLERIPSALPFEVFVDYAHTEDALRHALRTLRTLTPKGRLVVVFGCGGTRDVGKRPAMGRAAAELADQTVLTNDNPRKESPEAIATDIRRGYETVRTTGLHLELDRRRAIEWAVDFCREGDILLLAGKGHETYQEFEGAVAPFDDRVVAREALEARRNRETARESLNFECLLV